MSRTSLCALATLVIVLGSGCVHAPASAPPASVKLSPEHIEPELITVHYRVKAGETLYRIAKAYGLTVEELMAANGIADARALAVGTELSIPGAEHEQPVPPPEIGALQPAEDTPAPAPHGAGHGSGSGMQAAIASASSKGRRVTPETHEDPSEPTPIRVPVPAHGKPAPPSAARAGSLQWPLRGVLYARFGKKGKEPHDGIDLAAPEGTPVATAAEGTVLYAGEQRGYGLIAIVEHENGLVTLYAHNRDLRVKTGQRVRAGQVVATVGESGRTSGPHLHFEVRKDGVPVDPLPYLGAVH